MIRYVDAELLLTQASRIHVLHDCRRMIGFKGSQYPLQSNCNFEGKIVWAVRFMWYQKCRGQFRRA